MTQSLEVQEQNALKCAELLSKLVGLTVIEQILVNNTNQQPSLKSYEIKKISKVEMQYYPSPCVDMTYMDGLCERFTSLEQFNRLIGKIGDYGSIYEYLDDNNFSLFE